MQVLCRLARCDAEILAEPASKRVVDEQRLSRVAARGERLHQEPMPALAVGGTIDQASRGALGRVELTAADLDARTADELERADENLLEPPPLLVDPGRVLSRQQLSGCDVLRDAAGTPSACEVSLSDETLGTVQALCRRFQVDPRTARERQPHVPAPFERHDAA